MFCPKCGQASPVENSPTTCLGCGFNLAAYQTQLRGGSANAENAPGVSPVAIQPLKPPPSSQPPPSGPFCPRSLADFYQTRPLSAEPKPSSEPNETPVVTQPPQAAMSESGKRILIVEDDQMIAELYQNQLAQGGYAVDVAPDGQNGEALLGRNHYDLLLLDLMLPRENGLNLLKKMKADHRLPDMPVIIISNLDSGSAVDRGMALGATTYLVKVNHTPKDVLDVVRQTI